MAIPFTSKSDLLGWVVSKWKPSVAQFKAWMNSYRHREDAITFNDLDTTLKTVLQNAGAGADGYKIGYYATNADRPTTGDVKTLYIVTSTNKVFAWIDAKYEQVGGGDGGGLTDGDKGSVTVDGDSILLNAAAVLPDNLAASGTKGVLYRDGSSMAFMEIELPKEGLEYLTPEVVQEIPFNPEYPHKYREIEADTLILLTRLSEGNKGTLYLLKKDPLYTITTNGRRGSQILPDGLVKLEYYYINGELTVNCRNPGNYD